MNKKLISIEPVRDLVKQKLIEQYDNTKYINTSSIDVKVDITKILEEHIESINAPEPSIYITPDAYIKMRMLVEKTTTEIGWYGTVSKVVGLENVYVIEDILVYPQKVTGATCEQDDDRLFEFEMSLTTEQVNMKRFQGHSHVNMGTTPSGVDEQFYQDLLTQVTDYFIITITNKRNEYTTRFYDIANNILYTDVPIKVIFDDGSEASSWYDTAKEQLDTPKPVSYNYQNPYYKNKDKKHKDKKDNFKGSIFDKDQEDWYDYLYDRRVY